MFSCLKFDLRLENLTRSLVPENGSTADHVHSNLAVTKSNSHGQWTMNDGIKKDDSVLGCTHS
jgi:hypothetical protein